MRTDKTKPGRPVAIRLSPRPKAKRIRHAFQARRGRRRNGGK